MHPVKNKKKWWQITFGVILKLLLAVLVFLGSYFLLALILGLTPVNRHFQEYRDGISIFVLSNGVHTDIVVPTLSSYLDWRKIFPDDDFPAAIGQAPYLGIGWGDKGFYLETPTWAELKPSVAFRAAFLPSPTAMHVTYHLQEPQTGDKCRKLFISPEQYLQLIDYIKASFQKDTGEIMLIPEKGYGTTDNFYEAMGTYNMIHTCNMWVATAFKKVGIRTAVWSPFDLAILYQLEP